MDTRNGHPTSTRIPRDQQIRTCRPAVVKEGRGNPPQREPDSGKEWNIVRGED
ncbi:hypothetical protein OG937_07000 [Streptomyces sp. NBC_00510]|uniref:Uncharacterized protein n=1 Tax=Actinacidiphila glaucinigra TaxID=235986 RepID=A0A239CMU6_9ACTN|nr:MULTISPECIES: hypothetical protein [Streptomycetaceae]MDX2644964.1 hypothetical protein [Streptomyces sp. PA03-1a]MDX2706992.1 hypothetical protein [Streptomyces sp. PA03-6a]MDX2814875.1 hypothetical protein [Streptomyces sp. PA03-5A]MDX2849484.1 hypothetical protein [Streptomyces sp. PA03-3a]WSD58609.1 hypothetical protein OIE69_06640 [Actinacidiphila glaucinigra]